MRHLMNAKKSYRKLYKFWIGPLVAGSCLAAGYEATHRFMILRSNWQAPKVEALKNQGVLTSKKLDSNSDVTIQPFPNSNDTQVKKEKGKFSEHLVHLQEKEMQQLLHTLKASLEDPQRHKKHTQNRNLNLADTQILLRGITFDDLFKTLPKQ